MRARGGRARSLRRGSVHQRAKGRPSTALRSPVRAPGGDVAPKSSRGGGGARFESWKKRAARRPTLQLSRPKATGGAVRTTTLLRCLLGVDGVVVEGFELERPRELVLRVRPRRRKPRCSSCGRTGGRWVRGTRGRRWRHLDLAVIRCWLVYDLRRVECRSCGWKTEAVPWCSTPKSGFTDLFDRQISGLAQHANITAVAETLQIAWASARKALGRVVKERGPADPLAGLEAIGVDEISYRKGHRYLTVVTDLRRGVVVWAGEGKSGATLERFLDELGPDRAGSIRVVAADMSAAYRRVIEQRLGHAELVFDRFHVQQLVSAAVDRTRREEWQRLRRSGRGAEATSIKGSRWVLLKGAPRRTPRDQERLSRIQQENRRLYRAYLLKEQFVEIMNQQEPLAARQRLGDWLAWASRSRLPAFVKVARTVRGHLEGIEAYWNERLTNGVTEGLNNKARNVMRRAYGFHSAEAAIAMVLFTCSGIALRPIHQDLGVRRVIASHV